MSAPGKSLSENLIELGEWLESVRTGEFEITPLGINEFQQRLRACAIRAIDLEFPDAPYPGPMICNTPGAAFAPVNDNAGLQ